MVFSNFIPITPANFFAYSLDCHYSSSHDALDKKFQLPNFSSFHEGSHFADVYMGWHESGLFFTFNINGIFNNPNGRNFAAGDSIEIFLDTRDVKNAANNTRFCHHFYFLPEDVADYLIAAEVSRFRTDDAHELCDPAKLVIRSIQEKKRCSMHIFIPAECLHGYDPTQFKRIGFTYCINRQDGSKQFFSASDEAFAIENQPSIWASLTLRKHEI